MKYDWSERKNETNIEMHGFDFSDVENYFNWESAVIIEDNRFDYGEQRYQATGYANNRLTILIYTKRDKVIRLISWRKANAREVKRYESNI